MTAVMKSMNPVIVFLLSESACHTLYNYNNKITYCCQYDMSVLLSLFSRKTKKPHHPYGQQGLIILLFLRFPGIPGYYTDTNARLNIYRIKFFVCRGIIIPLCLIHNIPTYHACKNKLLTSSQYLQKTIHCLNLTGKKYYLLTIMTRV